MKNMHPVSIIFDDFATLFPVIKVSRRIMTKIVCLNKSPAFYSASSSKIMTKFIMVKKKVYYSLGQRKIKQL